jgi:hypothetical protein
MQRTPIGARASGTDNWIETPRAGTAPKRIDNSYPWGTLNGKTFKAAGSTAGGLLTLDGSRRRDFPERNADNGQGIAAGDPIETVTNALSMAGYGLSFEDNHSRTTAGPDKPFLAPRIHLLLLVQRGRIQRNPEALEG